MPCSSPLRAWFKSEVNASGKRSIQFHPNGAHGDSFLVSCGKCYSCRSHKADEWGTRVDSESRWQRSQGVVEQGFFRLSYDDEHLPPGGSLRKRDLILWQKRAREYCWRRLRRRVRFISCGEYGDYGERPHYHSACFGWACWEDRYPWTKSGEYRLFRSPTLEKLWPLGHSTVGDVQPGCGAYIGSYTAKKRYGEGADAHYRGREPEFLVMSKGLGVAGFKVDLAVSVAADAVVVTGGHAVPIPRGYERHIPEAMLAELKERRIARLGKGWRDRTPRRLADREEFKIRKRAVLKKRRTF